MFTLQAQPRLRYSRGGAPLCDVMYMHVILLSPVVAAGGLAKHLQHVPTVPFLSVVIEWSSWMYTCFGFIHFVPLTYEMSEEVHLIEIVEAIYRFMLSPFHH